MDNLELYLTHQENYDYKELSNILETKINITKNHVRHIRFILGFYKILILFEKYGYIFTDNDYKHIASKYPFILERIPNDNITDEICKIAVRTEGCVLYYVPDDKKTDEICESAVLQNGFALQYVPDDKKTDEICESAVLQNGFALQYVPENKKSEKICGIAVGQYKTALKYVPNAIKNKIISGYKN